MNEIDPLCAISPQTTPLWPPRLVFDLALGLDAEEEILRRHMITPSQWEVIREHPAFLRELVEQKRVLLDKGVSFRSKARVQAEEYLLELDLLINDRNIDPKVRLEAIRSIVKWAGLEPKEEKGDITSQNNIQVNINL